jgi:hypothetical protein
MVTLPNLPARMSFELEEVYEWTESLSIGSVPDEDAHEMVRHNARMLSFWMPAILTQRFSNLVEDRSLKGALCVRLPRGKPLKIANAASGKSCNVEPSGNKGKGRYSSTVDLATQRERLDGYIVVDVSQFPRIVMRGYPKARVYTEITRSEIDTWACSGLF